MFVDKVQVEVKAGDGGNGAVSFRQEKFVDKGGPDGGDGGKGGNVVLRASRNQNTLATFRYQKLIEAEAGEAGSKRRRHGKNGKDQLVDVPVGTVVSDSDGGIVADLKDDGASTIIAKGGSGGFGNAHFVSSTRQAPRVAEKGEPGEEFEFTLELKMIADVGLVGLPNAGKSTLLASISNARPEIANYPFTTIRPNLGMVDQGGTALLFADIPGLIEGASEGKGLGDDFLRHVERTRVLVHLIDIYQDDVAAAYKTIQQELAAYKVDLSTRPQIVALTKIEGFDKDIIDDKLAELKKALPKKTVLMAISSLDKTGIKELLFKVLEISNTDKKDTEEKIEETEGIPVIRLTGEDDSWQVSKTEKGYLVTGQKIERFAKRTNLDDFYGEQRLRDIMKKMGILHELSRQGIEAGQQIIIGKPELGRLEY